VERGLGALSTAVAILSGLTTILVWLNIGPDAVLQNFRLCVLLAGVVFVPQLGIAAYRWSREKPSSDVLPPTAKQPAVVTRRRSIRVGFVQYVVEETRTIANSLMVFVVSSLAISSVMLTSSYNRFGHSDPMLGPMTPTFVAMASPPMTLAPTPSFDAVREHEATAEAKQTKVQIQATHVGTPTARPDTTATTVLPPLAPTPTP
jgi:hypothetical protein